MDGKFIAFEGLDGSGQSTQMGLLTQALTEKGIRVHQTKEPTNNIIGGLIRGQLTKDWTTCPECLQLLFAADRSHHLEREVIPAMQKGFIVMTDRYKYSSIAFGALETDKDWLIAINSKFPVPDLIFYLDVPAEVCMERIKASRFEFELFEEQRKLEQIRNHYLDLAKDHEQFKVINANRPKEEIAAEIAEIVLREIDLGKLSKNIMYYK